MSTWRRDRVGFAGYVSVNVSPWQLGHPEFVARLCAQMGVAPEACLVIGGRRALLAAAAWIGARTVMVPDDSTPLFDCRGLRLAPDLESAVQGALEQARG